MVDFERKFKQAVNMTSSRLYFGTVEWIEDSKHFAINGVRVYGSVNPKTGLDLIPTGEDGNGLSINIRELETRWENEQVCAMVFYAESPTHIIESILIFNKKDRETYPREVDLKKK